MSLKITLKPDERLVVGSAVIANDGRHPCSLIIQNNAPVLREKDILSERAATTPCGRLYFTIQLMFIDQTNPKIHVEQYWKITKEIIETFPIFIGYIDRISENIVNDKYYKALKLAGKLIEREQEVLRNVCQSAESV